MTGYLARVESSLGVRTRWGLAATGVERRGDGSTLHLITDVGEVQTRNVVCATGAAAHPVVPTWAPELTAPGVAIHSSNYRHPGDIPAGDVLIVGGGNSGVQLARELSNTHTVSLALRTPRRRRHHNSYPHAAGETTDWLRRTRLPEPLFGISHETLRRLGVRMLPAAVSARGTTVTFADGTAAEPTSVIFATGYTAGDRWIPDAARPERARHCATRFPGLFVAGIPRYSIRGADTLAGVWKDAITIAHQIINRP